MGFWEEDDGADNGSDFLKASSKGAKSKPATSTNPDKPSYTDAPLPKRAMGGMFAQTCADDDDVFGDFNVSLDDDFDAGLEPLSKKAPQKAETKTASMSDWNPSLLKDSAQQGSVMPEHDDDDLMGPERTGTLQHLPGGPEAAGIPLPQLPAGLTGIQQQDEEQPQQQNEPEGVADSAGPGVEAEGEPVQPAGAEGLAAEGHVGAAGQGHGVQEVPGVGADPTSGTMAINADLAPEAAYSDPPRGPMCRTIGLPPLPPMPVRLTTPAADPGHTPPQISPIEAGTALINPSAATEAEALPLPPVINNSVGHPDAPDHVAPGQDPAEQPAEPDAAAAAAAEVPTADLSAGGPASAACEGAQAPADAPAAMAAAAQEATEAAAAAPSATEAAAPATATVIGAAADVSGASAAAVTDATQAPPPPAFVGHAPLQPLPAAAGAPIVPASRQSPVLPASAAPVSTQPISPGSTAAATANKAAPASAPPPTATVAAAAAAPGPQAAVLSPATKEIAAPSAIVAAAAAPGAASGAPCSPLPAGNAAAASAGPPATQTAAGSTAAAAAEPASRPIVREPVSHDAAAATGTAPEPLLKSGSKGPDNSCLDAAAGKPASTAQQPSLPAAPAAATGPAATTGAPHTATDVVKPTGTDALKPTPPKAKPGAQLAVMQPGSSGPEAARKEASILGSGVPATGPTNSNGGQFHSAGQLVPAAAATRTKPVVSAEAATATAGAATAHTVSSTAQPGRGTFLSRIAPAAGPNNKGPIFKPPPAAAAAAVTATTAPAGHAAGQKHHVIGSSSSGPAAPFSNRMGGSNRSTPAALNISSSSTRPQPLPAAVPSGAGAAAGGGGVSGVINAPQPVMQGQQRTLPVGPGPAGTSAAPRSGGRRFLAGPSAGGAGGEGGSGGGLLKRIGSSLQQPVLKAQRSTLPGSAAPAAPAAAAQRNEASPAGLYAPSVSVSAGCGAGDQGPAAVAPAAAAATASTPTVDSSGVVTTVKAPTTTEQPVSAVPGSISQPSSKQGPAVIPAAPIAAAHAASAQREAATASLADQQLDLTARGAAAAAALPGATAAATGNGQLVLGGVPGVTSSGPRGAAAGATSTSVLGSGSPLPPPASKVLLEPLKRLEELRIAGLALNDNLSDLRVKVAIQQSRTTRLYNPMLEARIKQLAERIMATAARAGITDDN